MSMVQAQELPRLDTNEAYLDEVLRRPTTLQATDPLAVFAFVLSSLPDRVKVYPTENYYYFRFMLNGTPYAGSIRLPPGDRDEGKLEFGYYKDLTEWSDVMEGDTHLVVGPSTHGLKVEQLHRFEYRVTYFGRSVIFALNDLSAVKPTSSAIGKDEMFLGPIFDESGVQFFLVYNARLKIFHYILDDTVRLADDFYRPVGMNRVLIGRRTG